ncbi:ATP-binding cassette sub-family G member 3-like [Peromyscus leucopus]|uniref:ATP-binding cassette sub-family G member 3-like n=1 Tax=Peromyscus leucopus TaxID=10041 RepID=UPI001884BB91|nr:ATP-binding cassette sub-family G member 3-like [Peromyscus leucopus]
MRQSHKPKDLPSTCSELSGSAVIHRSHVIPVFITSAIERQCRVACHFVKKQRKKDYLNVNGIMRPGLNAIMGPEDGSRSWLLDVLAARQDPRGLLGDILINGKPRPANFKCTSGYVPQKDVVMHTVTVRDNIEFSAALRLPMTVTRDERRRRIDEVLELLHLDKVANVQPRSKELRKRTSIAMELVTEHPILFLDDPTTDLDLVTTIDVILDMKR